MTAPTLHWFDNLQTFLQDCTGQHTSGVWGAKLATVGEYVRMVMIHRCLMGADNLSGVALLSLHIANKPFPTRVAYFCLLTLQYSIPHIHKSRKSKSTNRENQFPQYRVCVTRSHPKRGTKPTPRACQGAV